MVYAKLHPVLDPLSEDLQADLQIKRVWLALKA